MVGPSERYMQYYCRIFGISASDLRTSGDGATGARFSPHVNDADTALDLLSEGRALLRDLGREILVILAAKAGLGHFEVKGLADDKRA